MQYFYIDSQIENYRYSMTDVRPQAMALQNSITLDKKFGIEISIFHQTGQTRCQTGHVKHRLSCYCATKVLLKIIKLAICQFSIYQWGVRASACQYVVSTERAGLFCCLPMFCSAPILSSSPPPPHHHNNKTLPCTLHHNWSPARL